MGNAIVLVSYIRFERSENLNDCPQIEGDYQELNGAYALVSPGSGNHVCRTNKCFTGRNEDGSFLPRSLGAPRSIAASKGAMVYIEMGTQKQRSVAQQYFNDYGMKAMHVCFQRIRFSTNSAFTFAGVHLLIAWL